MLSPFIYQQYTYNSTIIDLAHFKGRIRIRTWIGIKTLPIRNTGTFYTYTKSLRILKTSFAIRIRMFLGLLLDPDQEPLVRGMDPASDTSIISKNSQKTLIPIVL
jgi:hypothetical protein